jgi:hypothetical protein
VLLHCVAGRAIPATHAAPWARRLLGSAWPDTPDLDHTRRMRRRCAASSGRAALSWRSSDPEGTVTAERGDAACVPQALMRRGARGLGLDTLHHTTASLRAKCKGYCDSVPPVWLHTQPARAHILRAAKRRRQPTPYPTDRHDPDQAPRAAVPPGTAVIQTLRSQLNPNRPTAERREQHVL